MQILLPLLNRCKDAVRRGPVVVLAIAALSVVASCNRVSPDAAMAAAKAHAAKGNFSAAAVEFKNVLQSQDNAEAHLLLGDALFALGQFKSAETHLRRALALNHPRDAVLPSLARVLSGGGDYNQLVTQFADVTLRDPQQNAALRTLLGEAFLALSRQREAASAFEAALVSVPSLPRARVGQGRVLAHAGDIAAAAIVVEGILATDPAQPQALALKADLLLAQQRPKEARGVLEQLAAAEPFNSQARIGLISLALAENNFSDAAAKIADMRKALPLDMRGRYLEAVLAFRQKEFAKARDVITEILRVAPDHAPSLLLAGAVAYSQGLLSTAESNLRKVLVAFPDSLYARQLLVSTYLRGGQPTKAEQVLAPALKIAPNNPDVLRAAGEISLANSRVADAARYYEQALAREKDGARAATLARLAQIRHLSGDTARALEDLEVASTLDPREFQADLSLIASHLQRRNYSGAMAAVAALEKKQPSNPLTHALRGAIQIAKGDSQAARPYLERALALQANYLPAVRMLAGLDARDRKPDAALARFDSIIAAEPGNEEAFLAKAEAQAILRAPPREIAATIERAIKANGASASARIALVRHHWQDRDAKAALGAAMRAAEAMPDDTQILDILGLAQVSAGEIERAIETFGMLVKRMPDSPGPLLRLASAQYAAKQIDAPIEALNKALAIRPGMVEAHRDLIAMQLAAGRSDDALREARKLQSARPREAIGYALEGEVLATQKKFAEAANAFSESNRRQPEANVVVRQHQALVAAGRVADADALARRWLKEHPDEPVVRFYLANSAMQGKDFLAATARYREMLARQPDDPAILNNLAWALNEANDPSALSFAERAYAKAPASPEVQDTYGWLLVGSGDAKRGVALLSQAAQARPNSVVIRMHLAKAHIAAGDQNSARKELEAVVAIGTDVAATAEAKRLLQMK